MSTTGDGAFPPTRWTLIERLKSSDDTIARRALEALCTQYYYPLYCYIRRRGFEHHDAQDALHDFLAKLLRLRAFDQVDAERGRLRAFLGTSLRRFLINWRRDRQDRESEVSLELGPPSEDAELRYRAEHFDESDSAERVFDRKWGHELLEGVLHRLGENYAGRGRSPLFEKLRPVLLGGGSLRIGDTAQIGATLGMSEGAVRVALFRLLGEYRAILEEEILQTVDSRAEVEVEIAHLLGVFRAA